MTFVIDVNRYIRLIILVIIKQECSVSGGCYISARQNILIFLKILFRTQSLITDDVIKTLNPQLLSKMFYWHIKDQMFKVSLKCYKLLVTLFIYFATNWHILHKFAIFYLFYKSLKTTVTLDIDYILFTSR